MKYLLSLIALWMLASPLIARAQDGRTTMRFATRSPLSSAEEVRKRLDDYEPEFPKPPGGVRIFDYNLAEESFDVFVPPGCKAGVPHGIFVWMGNSEISPPWLDVFAKQKLIYIAPVRRTHPIPLGLSLDAIHNLKAQFPIDENRVYVSGFSASGGKAATMCMRWPEIFSGGLFMMGGWFYDVRPLDNGRYDARMKAFVWKGDLDRAKANIRLVIIRGEQDSVFLPAEGRGQYESLLLDGFQHAALLVVSRTGHALPNATWLSRGIDALDHPKDNKPPTTSPTADAKPSAGQIAVARQMLSAAQWFVSKPRAESETLPFLQRVIDEYPTTPSAKTAREMLKKLDQPSSRPSRPK